MASRPAPSPESHRESEGATHSGRLLVRMPQTLHGELARAAEKEGVSLNAFITSALASAVRWRVPGDGPQPSAARANGAGKPGAVPEPVKPAPRGLSIALVANFVLVAIAAAAAIALTVVALT